MIRSKLQLFKFIGRGLADAKLADEQVAAFIKSFADQAYRDNNTKAWCVANIAGFHTTAKRELEILNDNRQP